MYSSKLCPLDLLSLRFMEGWLHSAQHEKNLTGIKKWPNGT